MNGSNIPLNFNEKVIFSLRSLYSKCGYQQYKMSKFEEYDLYARNKDFLISDSVITFTDTNGKLMALKPDVTLSIIKNIKEQPDCVQKLYYNENVYRISKGTRSYKEIMQIGLECFGNIDNFNICEVITLAALSLKSISEECVLDISDIGLLEDIIDGFELPKQAKSELFKHIGEKNIHELISVCAQHSVPEKDIAVLTGLIETSGSPDTVINKIAELLEGRNSYALSVLSDILNAVDSDVRNMLRIDFSVVGDTNYYNGIVFKGFIQGVPTAVLSGGQYDKLMRKMHRKSGAIGFAVYLDVLERLLCCTNEYDVDILLLYDDTTPLSVLNDYIKNLGDAGRIMAQRCVPENIKYKKLIKINNGEVDILEDNA